MTGFVAVSGNKVDAVSTAIKRLFARSESVKESGQAVRSGSVRAGTGKRALTELMVIALLLAIPSKLIWDKRDANLAYIANTAAQRLAVQQQVAQGETLASQEASYKALELQNALKVPKTIGYSGIVSTLTALAGRMGVELVSVTAPSRRPDPIAGSVYQWTINVTITGSFPAIQSYIDTLQNEQRLYQVQQVQIGVASGGAGGGVASGAGPGAAAGHTQTFSGGIDNAVLAINVETVK